MSPDLSRTKHAVEAIPLLKPLWDALFDHHRLIGAAGLATIPKSESWPLRRHHYERLFAADPTACVFVARSGGRLIGYAMAFSEETEDARQNFVLETLSVLPDSRGVGAGTALLRICEDEAQHRSPDSYFVDVMGGNDRARNLYTRFGFEAYSESWMRSVPHLKKPALSGDLDLHTPTASVLGLDISVCSGPDDTWVTANQIVELSLQDVHPLSFEFLPDTQAVEQLRYLPLNPSRLLRFLTELDADGLWTQRFELPAYPQAASLRAVLSAAGFRLSTERLRRVNRPQ